MLSIGIFFNHVFECQDLKSEMLESTLLTGMLANKWTEVNLFITEGKMATSFEDLEFCFI